MTAKTLLKFFIYISISAYCFVIFVFFPLISNLNTTNDILTRVFGLIAFDIGIAIFILTIIVTKRDNFK